MTRIKVPIKYIEDQELKSKTKTKIPIKDQNSGSKFDKSYKAIVGLIDKNNLTPLTRNKKIVVALIYTSIFVIAVFSVLINQESKKLEEKRQNPNSSAISPDEVKKLEAEVRQFIALPEGEDPSVVTIADAEKIRSKSFFANGQNGDKVLIYSRAGKAILYRPSTKKVIEVTDINLTNNPQKTDN